MSSTASTTLRTLFCCAAKRCRAAAVSLACRSTCRRTQYVWSLMRLQREHVAVIGMSSTVSECVFDAMALPVLGPSPFTLSLFMLHDVGDTFIPVILLSNDIVADSDGVAASIVLGSLELHSPCDVDGSTLPGNLNSKRQTSLSRPSCMHHLSSSTNIIIVRVCVAESWLQICLRLVRTRRINLDILLSSTI